MSLDIRAVQEALRAEGLDGWLLYDFRGSNPLAQRLAGLDGGHLATRRWFYLIPALGPPRGLVHKIEPRMLAHLPGESTRYAGRTELETGLATVLAGVRRVAMEYSPMCAIPYVSRVDAGTVELVRAHGVDVVSSADLVQQFEAVWSAEALASHRDAAQRLYRVKDRAFAAITDRMREQRATTEYDIQAMMLGWFDDEGLITDSPPIVAAQENAGDPHYQPTAAASRAISPGNVVLLDLWGKLPTPGAVFADISWMGFTGPAAPAEVTAAFSAARDARDAAVALIESAAAAGRPVRGWEADRAAREVIAKAGFAAAILHRTGHSLGEEIHGNGAHLDDYETHDERRLIPGTGFTIEPGVYSKDFGVRTEINMFVAEREATVTGPLQMAFVPL
jgi:Xaa-Pro dipeptidase